MTRSLQSHSSCRCLFFHTRLRRDWSFASWPKFQTSHLFCASSLNWFLVIQPSTRQEAWLVIFIRVICHLADSLDFIFVKKTGISEKTMIGSVFDFIGTDVLSRYRHRSVRCIRANVFIVVIIVFGNFLCYTSYSLTSTLHFNSGCCWSKVESIVLLKFRFFQTHLLAFLATFHDAVDANCSNQRSNQRSPNENANCYVHHIVQFSLERTINFFLDILSCHFGSFKGRQGLWINSCDRIITSVQCLLVNFIFKPD